MPAARTILSRTFAQAIFLCALSAALLSGCGSAVLSDVQRVSPNVQWSTPTDITYGTTLSAAQFDATASVAGHFTYSPALNTMPNVGTTTLTVTFTPDDIDHYSAQSVSVNLRVNKATPTITWPTPAAITYGTTLSATQFDAKANVAGTFTYTPANGTMPTPGSNYLSTTFIPTDTTHYNNAFAAVMIAVNQATPTITWPTPAPITAGTALSATQLNARANVPGTFTYSPAKGTVPAAGTTTLSATFTPTNTTNYKATTASVILTVKPTAKTTPTITWPTPAAITAGTALSATQLDATASVPGTFTYTPAAGTVTSAGTFTLSTVFTPTDTTLYNNATASVTLTVNAPIVKTTPTITWPTPAPITLGTAISATQLDATANVAGTFAYSVNIGLIPLAGTLTLSTNFTPTDTIHYNNTTASVTLTINLLPSNNTVINVGSSVIHTGMKRVGMNIDGQSFFDSGQMMKNLVFRNPGFEGETWQSILHCSAVTSNTCTDENPWAVWPANFLQGATFEFIYGSANGETGTVVSSTAANLSANAGVTLTFPSLAKPPAVGDFVVVRMTVPGNGQAGWWTSVSGGSTITTELADLSPNTQGKQALRVTAANAGQVATVDSYFDSTGTHKFILLNGTYQITFRAKGVGGNNQLNISLGRQINNGTYFNQTITLPSTWQDYTYTFTANETTSTSPGVIDFHFGVNGASVLLDDVSITPVSSTNPTVFRDEVVNTLTALHPGSLRYMDGLPTFGSSIDNMLTPPFARLRAGSSTQNTETDDIPIGLHEFLQLCQTVGADPWFTMPPAMTPAEMQNLIEYFAGSASTTYGAKRAALGQSTPWTQVFTTIHLELGNEQWNSGTFPGNAIDDPIAYGNRITTIFAAAHAAPDYNANNFDLVMGSFVQNPWYTGQELSAASNYDSVSVAPYLFGSFNDTSSNEAIFAPMFAEPEMWDSTPLGFMAQQSLAVTAAGKKLVTYEENLSTQSGTASQAMLDATIPSVAGGITMADHMLLQMRDLGIQTQNVWALPGYNNGFSNTNGGQEISPVFGTVIDMGGETNRQRPVFLAEQLVNTAILPSMLGTTITGPNPTWIQLLSTNDNVLLPIAHDLQTFAFTDGGTSRSVVVVNLSRSGSTPITFSGENAPTGNVTIGQLTSANITDSNETSNTVIPTTSTVSSFDPTAPYSLPPFSVTVFTWSVNPAFGGVLDGQ